MIECNERHIIQALELFNEFKFTFVGEKEAFWNLLFPSVLYTGGVAFEEKPFPVSVTWLSPDHHTKMWMEKMWRKEKKKKKPTEGSTSRLPLISRKCCL